MSGCPGNLLHCPQGCARLTLPPPRPASASLDYRGFLGLAALACWIHALDVGAELASV